MFVCVSDSSNILKYLFVYYLLSKKHYDDDDDDESDTMKTRGIEKERERR